MIHNMKPSQQRVYDILKDRYPKWTNKGQLRQLYYPDSRESYDTYMGRLINELDHMDLLEKRDPIIDGKKTYWREYRLKSIEAQISPDNKKSSDSAVDPEIQSKIAEFGSNIKNCNTGQRQVNNPCPKCGSYYRIGLWCKKGCMLIRE